ncbi:Phosphotransferase enzyme family [Bordetella ansorpii]|uniref:Phosphotransferase enzyme family n=2 Tax=Bordetella ansorpii TaxID=288768 RepID=A0A157STS1_9BORD|nr:Phosphotransferase enzyme family [Bordetella ansorpii]
MDSVKEIDVAALLERHWGLRADSVRATPTGHTNKTYVARARAREVVLRVSWTAKPERQVRDEAKVLRHLAGVQGLPAVPRLVPTWDGQPCAREYGRWLHVFDVIAGEVGEFGEAAVDARDGVYPPASDTSDADHARGVASAMHTLARLHAALAVGIAADTADPLSWLRGRHARVAERACPVLPSMTPERYGILLTRIADRLAVAGGIPGPVQWLHGDYHAGNLLYRDRHVCGILDFDDVGQGSPWVETAFALFALSRDVAREDAFVFDASAWDGGLHAYAQIQAHAPIGWLRSNRGMLMHLFCADQVLIHLHAAQRGLWMPGPGMGFLGCVRQLWDARWP